MRIGVTGIFASGKGTVCEMFAELGANVIDTDIIAREIFNPGEEGLERIINKFGDKYINNDGTLDRRGFANFIFSDEKKVKQLNDITHPLILDVTMARSNGEDTYMINTPLLYESGFDSHMDKNIVVVSDLGQVIRRGIKRDEITEKEIRDRLAHQIPLNVKVKIADHVIDNSGSLDNTKRQVVELWKILKEIPRD